MTRPVTAGAIIWLIATIAACEREARPFDVLRQSSKSDAGAAAKPTVTESTLHPGDVPAPQSGTQSPFGGNAWGMAEGKRLFNAYNCVGCHANGGGGMGPPLMDDRWIYGSEPANIYQTIVEGRPNGMPAFRNKIPQAQVWMLVAYIQSLNGQAPIDVMPSRADHMRVGTPENVRGAVTPIQSGVPR